MHQALLLLHCVYAFDRRSWLAALSPEDLLELAAITHKFAAVSIFDLVHATLVQRCSGGRGGKALHMHLECQGLACS